MSTESAKETLVQRALSGHAALGLLASALLYIIALTGAIVVIHDRWQRWEQPNVAEYEALSPIAVQAALQAGLAADRGKPATTHLYIRMPDGALPRAVVTTDHSAWYVGADGSVVDREAHTWTEMVIGLHEYLHLPVLWGMALVGVLGVVLAALLLTGVLAHPRIIRDAFRLRTRHDPQIARADWHNRLGVWTLPFVMAVTLTGAFIGLGSAGFAVLAQAYHGGDLEQAYAPIFGDEPAHDAARAPLPNVAAALTTLSRQVPGVTPTYVIVHDPGTRGQHVQVIAEHPRRLIYGETYTFDANGAMTGKVGLSDGELGRQLAASTYNLHFGNYGGLPVEIAYILLGLALCVVTSTGTTLWLGKRRRRGRGSAALEASWTAVIWGTPLALVATAWIRVIAGADAPLVAAFWGLLMIAILAGMLRPAAIQPGPMRAATLGATALTGIAHLAWFRPDDAAIVTLDLLMAGGGLLALGLLGHLPRRRATDQAYARQAAPAE